LGDEHRLRQVASNLAANAIQHTPPEASVTVRVGRRAADPVEVAVPGWAPGTNAAILEVADTGPGIPAEHAERVFERLYRVDPSRSRQDGGGSGLGLSIVTAIVESHGGKVELETTPGRGCVFRVLLPEAPAR
jgi:two-component system OmpR family sensor kinase